MGVDKEDASKHNSMPLVMTPTSESFSALPRALLLLSPASSTAACLRSASCERCDTQSNDEARSAHEVFHSSSPELIQERRALRSLRQQLSAAMCEISEDLHDLQASIADRHADHGRRHANASRSQVQYEHSAVEWRTLVLPTTPLHFRGQVSCSARAFAADAPDTARMASPQVCCVDSTDLCLLGGDEWDKDTIKLPIRHLVVGYDHAHPCAFSIKINADFGPETRIFMAASSQEAREKWLSVLARRGAVIQRHNVREKIRECTARFAQLNAGCESQPAGRPQRLVVWI